MLKERIQEVFEFTKSESPYRKANKGWINQDIFLDLSPSPDQVKQISYLAISKIPANKIDPKRNPTAKSTAIIGVFK